MYGDLREPFPVHSWYYERLPEPSVDEMQQALNRPLTAVKVSKRHAHGGFLHARWKDRFIQCHDRVGAIMMFRTASDVERGTPAHIWPYSAITAVGQALGSRHSFAFDVKFGEAHGLRLGATSKAQRSEWILGLIARSRYARPPELNGPADEDTPTGAPQDQSRPVLEAVGMGRGRYVRVEQLQRFRRPTKREFENVPDLNYGVKLHPSCWPPDSPLMEAGITSDEVLLAVGDQVCLSHKHASRLVADAEQEGAACIVLLILKLAPDSSASRDWPCSPTSAIGSPRPPPRIMPPRNHSIATPGPGSPPVDIF